MEGDLQAILIILKDIQKDVTELKRDVTELKTDVTELKM